MAHAKVQTLADVLKGHSEEPGVVCAGGGPVYSRGQLEQRIKYVANLLRKSGIKVGDTVSIAKANTVGVKVECGACVCAACAGTLHRSRARYALLYAKRYHHCGSLLTLLIGATS